MFLKNIIHIEKFFLQALPVTPCLRCGQCRQLLPRPAPSPLGLTESTSSRMRRTQSVTTSTSRGGRGKNSPHRSGTGGSQVWSQTIFQSFHSIGHTACQMLSFLGNMSRNYSGIISFLRLLTYYVALLLPELARNNDTEIFGFQVKSELI